MVSKRFKIVSASLITLAVATVPTMAQDTMSYRLQGMSTELVNIMDDEYTDINEFSVNLAKLDGYRLYTPLTNLEDEHREVISGKRSDDGSNVSGAKNAMGVLGSSKAVNFGAFYEPEQHYTTTENSTSAAQDDVNVELLNAGSSSTESQSQKSKSTYTASNGKVMVAKQITPDLALGASLSFGKSNNTNTYDNSYQWTSTNTDPETGKQTRAEVETGDQTQLLGEKGTNFGVEGSLALKLGSGTVYVGAATNPSSNERKGDFTSARSYKLDETGVDWKINSNESFDSGWWSEEYPKGISQITDDSDLRNYSLKGKYVLPINILGKPAALKTFVDYFNESGGQKMTSIFTGNMERSEKYTNLDLTSTHSENGNILVNYPSVDGTIDSGAINVGLGTEITLNPSTRLALGVKSSSWNWKVVRTSNGSNSTETYNSYDNGVQNKQESYLRTENSTDKWTETYEIYHQALSIPVGIETSLTSKLSLRLGATAYLNQTDSWDWRNRTDKGITETKTDYVDPNVEDQTTKVDLTGTYNESSHKESWNSSSTVYRVGLGYTVNDNVQIDVLRFGEITRLDKWLISTTVKF